MTSRILFICKNREVQNEAGDGYTYSSGGKSSGLLNSVKFVVDMLLEDKKVECKLVDVTDNNDIDREVSLFKPTHVIIEALWVVPTKFSILTKLHPTVKWIVRLHSEIPFIASEGIAFDWIPKYFDYPNVFVSANSKRMCEDITGVYGNPVIHLPNFYPIAKQEAPSKAHPKLKNRIKRFFKPKFNSLSSISGPVLHIGCFGAIRPLKNQLIQAVAAMRFADSVEKQMEFHINGNRVEGKGDNALKNLRALFAGQDTHKLVEHSWMPHDIFCNLLKNMDINMQVSFSETYNIVAADSIAAGVPVVSSTEITFVPKECQASFTDSSDIMSKLRYVYEADLDVLNRAGHNNLTIDAQLADIQWDKVFKNQSRFFIV